MNQDTKLSLIQKCHDEILDPFDGNKQELLKTFDDFFSCWLADPFNVDYSKEDRQKYFQLYVALKKQVTIMEYQPQITERLKEIKLNDVKEKYSKLDINFHLNENNN